MLESFGSMAIGAMNPAGSPVKGVISVDVFQPLLVMMIWSPYIVAYCTCGDRGCISENPPSPPATLPQALRLPVATGVALSCDPPIILLRSEGWKAAR